MEDMGSKSKFIGSPIPYSFIPSESENDNPNKLFLGGVSPEITEKQLEEFFSQFGNVKDVRIVTDRVTAECKGYGFVTFEDNEDVSHLVQRKTIRMRDGTKLRIREAIRRSASQFEHLPKKWLLMPNASLKQASSTFITPPNTPPNINAMSLLNLDTSYVHQQMVVADGPRERAYSSPQQQQQQQQQQTQQCLSPENDASYPVYFPNNLPKRYHYRRRSSSEPVTPEELQHLQELHASRTCPPPLLPPQTQQVFVPSPVPNKMFNPQVPYTPNQYFFPPQQYYHIPENFVYLTHPPAASLPPMNHPIQAIHHGVPAGDHSKLPGIPQTLYQGLKENIPAFL